MDSHQNVRLMSSMVRWRPGCPTSRESWPHSRTAGRWAVGTKILEAGVLGDGGGSRWWPSFTCSIKAQQTGATTQVSGRMGYSSSGRLSGTNWRERASGWTFFEPGRYERVKLKRVKKRAHLAWRGLSLRATPVVTKLFWPKITNSAFLTGKIYLLRRWEKKTVQTVLTT